MRHYVPKGRSLVEELLAERHEEVDAPRESRHNVQAGVDIRPRQRAVR